MVAQMDSVHIYTIFIMRTFLFYDDNPGECKWLFNIRIDDLIVCNMILSRSSNEKSNFFLKLSNSLKMVPLDPISTPIISISFRLYCNFTIHLRLNMLRLEIQADVNTAKRHSLSSETASVCLSMDDAAASTRGLAGSVLSYKVNIEDSKSELSCGQ